jgi:hypothetical protein
MLAHRPRRWHGVAMEPERRFSRAGGCLLALSLIAGVAGGAYAGQPSIGFLAGLGAGLLLLLAVWLADRRRR